MSGKDKNSTSGISDSGFGIVEILVSMMLFAILAVAVLPILVGAVTSSSRNSTLATATGMVQQEIEKARSQDTCSHLAADDRTVTDPRGVELKAHRSVESCPAAGYPLAISVRVDVSRANSEQPVASATTLVFVGGL